MILDLILVVFCFSFVQGFSGKAKVFNNDKPVEYYEMGNVDMLFTNLQKRQMKTRSAYLTVIKWPNNTIPYVVDPAFQNVSSRMLALTLAIQDYKTYTCIRLVPRTNETNYVNFVNGIGCYSYLGVNGGAQEISYGKGCDTTRGTPVHEIMHCLGFMHEHQRPDRDNYITINSNVVKGAEANFVKVNASDADLLLAYDLGSVMHYAKWAFSSNGLNTITTKDPKCSEQQVLALNRELINKSKYKDMGRHCSCRSSMAQYKEMESTKQDTIGQRNFFSACDIAKINKFYKCTGYKTTC